VTLIRRTALAAALGLAACDSGANRFEVEVKDGGAAGAVLILCGGDAIPLRRAGDRFVLVRRANCEGSGEVLVSFPSRPPVACPVGYVTPSLGQDFRFIVENGRCLELLDQQAEG